ncbi:MAG: hypothetical protein J6W41_01660 [Alphaproteobacteria bacterium]|nr:hypothetical protein [Alphaproteobacteria bacterium]
MKKILGGLFCALLVIAGANADETTIRAATTNTVRNKVFNINYGATNDLDGRNYRKGVIPQTNELNTARGNTTVSGSDSSLQVNGASVTVGNLGAVTNNAPTETITANTANIAVLKRDKLVTPGAGNCTTGVPCGYVSTGAHTNDTTNHVWLKIEGATVNNQTYYGNLPAGN